MGKNTVFITGSTGLLGSYIAKLLLQNGYRVYVLARAKDNKSAQERVIDTLRFWDNKILNEIDNLIVLEGDITQEGLGLNKKTVNLLKSQIEEIFHCAAVTLFNWPLNKIRKVNVEGTRNILELSLACRKLKKINHISTIFVHGDYKGLFREDCLDVGQKFNIPYEQSKFEAEKLIEKYRKKGLWINIYRPGIIIGESTSGKIFKFEHIYQLLHLWSLESLEIFPIKNASLNLSPVDLTSTLLYFLSTRVNIKNINYHLLSVQPISTLDFFDFAKNYIGFKKPIRIDWEKYNIDDLTPAQRILIKKVTIFNIISSTRVSCVLTKRILKKYKFHWPFYDNTFLVNIIKYALNAKFIKKI